MPEAKTNRCLSLDLDSTLIHSSVDIEELKNLKIYTDPNNVELRPRIYRFDLLDVDHPPGTGVVTSMWGVFRPHLHQFLKFAYDYFKHVYIWSAGKEKYVWKIKEQLERHTLNETGTEIKFQDVFSFDDCVMYPDKINKPLSKIFAINPDANETNTLALDDRDDTFDENFYNGIQIPVYEPKSTKNSILKDDHALLQLMCWLSLPEVLRTNDVRKLDKRYIFTTPLTEYYRKLTSVIANTAVETPEIEKTEVTASPGKSFYPTIRRIQK